MKSNHGKITVNNERYWTVNWQISLTKADSHGPYGNSQSICFAKPPLSHPFITPSPDLHFFEREDWSYDAKSAVHHHTIYLVYIFSKFLGRFLKGGVSLAGYCVWHLKEAVLWISTKGESIGNESTLNFNDALTKKRHLFFKAPINWDCYLVEV